MSPVGVTAVESSAVTRWRYHLSLEAQRRAAEARLATRTAEMAVARARTEQEVLERLAQTSVRLSATPPDAGAGPDTPAEPGGDEGRLLDLTAAVRWRYAHPSPPPECPVVHPPSAADYARAAAWSGTAGWLWLLTCVLAPRWRLMLRDADAATEQAARQVADCRAVEAVGGVEVAAALAALRLAEMRDVRRAQAGHDAESRRVQEDMDATARHARWRARLDHRV